MGYPIDYWNGRLGYEREQDQAEDDRHTRDQLERQSPKMVTSRVDIVGRLNAVARADAAGLRPAVERLGAIRKAQEKARFKAAESNYGYQRFEKLAEEVFDRLHPGSLRWAAAERPRNDFDNAADQRYVTPLTGAYERVRDADGSLRSDARTRRDHWPSGEVGDIKAEFLLEAARLLIEAVRSRQYAQGRV